MITAEQRSTVVHPVSPNAACAEMGKRATTCERDGDFLQRLTQSRLVRRSLAEFRRLTGLAAKVVSASAPNKEIQFHSDQNEFCHRVAALCRGCEACRRTQSELFRRMAGKLKAQQAGCPAGMIHLAVPVVLGGQQVATVVGGKVRVTPSGPAQFERVAQHLRQLGLSRQLPELRAAWFRAPLLRRGQLRAALRLLEALAQLFAEALNHTALRSSQDPPCIAEAKKFVRLHLGERLTTGQVAKAVHLNACYFCRLFRRMTGTTFRDYVARTRIEFAKAALLYAGPRIGEIAFAAGFQTLSDFNRVFKARTGMSPSKFRQQSRADQWTI